MAAQLAITALAVISGTALAAPTTTTTTNETADTADHQLKIPPDFQLGPGDINKLARRQDYTFNWTGIDNHLDFKPTSNGYSVTFKYASSDPTTVGDFAVGRGWSKGTDRNITFTGSTTTSSTEGLVSVSVYGWTEDPLVEYWIREYSNRPDYVPQGTKVGALESDGSTYDIYKHPLVPLPDSGIDTDIRWQYYSIRRGGSMRPQGGIVTTANHFKAWKENGMKLGTMGFQILATEGYKAAGSSEYTVEGS